MTFVRAVVTGASAGIGREFARQLAQRGTDLVLVARSREKLEELAQELDVAHGVTSEVEVADLTTPGDVARIADRIADDERPVDLVVNNAGFGTRGRFDQLAVDRELQEIDLNVGAVVRLSHAAAATMVRRGEGGILNVSSMAAYQPIPYFATYAATKAFVTSFTQALHEELKRTGVHVTVLGPGFTKTNFAEAAGATGEAARLPGPLWMEPGPVVAAGLKGVEKNQATVIPGWANQLTATVADFTPSTITRRIAGFSRRFTSP